MSIHFALATSLYFSKGINIKTSLPIVYSTDQYSAANDVVLSYIIFAWVSFLILFLCFFTGISMFRYNLSVLHSFFHIMGIIFLTLYITKPWPYEVGWYIVGPT
ncbi:hypothetical protein ROZALSC1DRAFT_29900, partial [Rozella allomycis CSF55]